MDTESTKVNNWSQKIDQKERKGGDFLRLEIITTT